VRGSSFIPLSGGGNMASNKKLSREAVGRGEKGRMNDEAAVDRMEQMGLGA
jgi:hypothetical protein